MSDSASLTDEDMARYAGQMEQIKARIFCASEFLEPPWTHPRVESGLLQLRLSLETLMLSSLITNRGAFEAVSKAFLDRKHNEAHAFARRVNPDYWPIPTSQRHDDHGKVVAMDVIEEGFLRESDYSPTWGRLSAWLHARSPFRPMPAPEAGVELGHDTLDKLTTLLNHHNVTLIDRSQGLVCMLHEAVTGRVHVFRFVNVDPES